MDKMTSYRFAPTDELNHYFRSAFSVSCVIFGLMNKKIHVLLVKRTRDPFKNTYSLPAELVYPNDSMQEKVDQIVHQITGTGRFYKKQIRAFTDTSRHPLGRVVSIGYYCFVDVQQCRKFEPSEEHKSADWFELKSIPSLAFDHNDIVDAAHRRLLAKMSTQLAGFDLLPEKFTIKHVQEMYEAVLGHELDKRNFRRKILGQDVIIETGETYSPWEESGKAPMLYRFDNEHYLQLKEKGNKFDIF
ncbi:MAG: NUDIX domain-containing protein [Bacteroidota bacterium]